MVAIFFTLSLYENLALLKVFPVNLFSKPTWRITFAYSHYTLLYQFVFTICLLLYQCLTKLMYQNGIQKESTFLTNSKNFFESLVSRFLQDLCNSTCWLLYTDDMPVNFSTTLMTCIVTKIVFTQHEIEDSVKPWPRVSPSYFHWSHQYLFDNHIAPDTTPKFRCLTNCKFLIFPHSSLRSWHTLIFFYFHNWSISLQGSALQYQAT